MLINLKYDRLSIFKSLFTKNYDRIQTIKNLIKGKYEIELDSVRGDYDDCIEFDATYTDTCKDVNDDDYYRIQDEFSDTLYDELIQYKVGMAESLYEGDR
jgi:hypothetical protein